MNVPGNFVPMCPQHFELSRAQTSERKNEQINRTIAMSSDFVGNNT